MEELNLSGNWNISDAEAAKLLDCLGNVKELELVDCYVSGGMMRKLKERGREVGCYVDV